MTKNSLYALSSDLFLLISVIIMICKSHFGEHLTTVKLSVCFIGPVTSLRQEWCSLPVWHQVEGLCLATDNNSVHIEIIFLLSFFLSTAPGCPNFLAGFWKMEACFWTRYRSDAWNFLAMQKATWQVESWCCRSWLIPKVSLCTSSSQDVLAEQRTFWNKMLIATLRLQR